MIKFILMWNLVYFKNGATPIAQYNTEKACLTTLKAYRPILSGALACIPTSVPIVVPK